MLHDGFKNIIPVLDNKEEFNLYDDEVEMETPCNLGIRIVGRRAARFAVLHLAPWVCAWRM
jgi:hypothetical protein